jgi:hypothetical protein
MVHDNFQRLENMHTEEANSGRVPTTSDFKVGDCVRVKPGTRDPDHKSSIIGGWCGRIREFTDDGLALIEWDSIVIGEMKIAQIRKYEKKGIEWGEMYLQLDELEKCHPRDNADDASEAISRIRWQHFRREYFPNDVEWVVPMIRSKAKRQP